MSISPPMYPPAGAPCAPGCSDLRAQYAEAVLRAQRCTVGAADPCGFKAPGSLGCNGCPVWVTDLSEVAPLANRFNQMGCYGCFFDGAGTDQRCHAVGCPDLNDRACMATPSGQGTCTNVTRQCEPGVMTGARCARQSDLCQSGSGFCYCHFSSPNWTCFGS